MAKQMSATSTCITEKHESGRVSDYTCTYLQLLIA